MRKKFYVETGCNQMVLTAKSEITACRILILDVLSSVANEEDDDIWFDEYIYISEAGFQKDTKGTQLEALSLSIPTSAILAEVGQEKMAELIDKFFKDEKYKKGEDEYGNDEWPFSLDGD